jgi:hypothetical protein
VIKDIIIGGLAVALVAALCATVWLVWSSSDLEAQNRTLSLSLQACDARNANIIEDIERDATVIDPDWVIPDHWLLPNTGTDSE